MYTSMQVFRRAVNVSSILFQITAYELPPTEASRDAAPTLRFIAYDPKTQMQVGEVSIFVEPLWTVGDFGTVK